MLHALIHHLILYQQFGMLKLDSECDHPGNLLWPTDIN